MTFAPGVEESEAVKASFASDAEAAAYWIVGVDPVPTEDFAYTGAAGQPQEARLYRGGPGPVLLYIHGGGWVGGSIALNERACQKLARESGSDVVSISYRLAPAHPFPAGLEDCHAALAELRQRFPGRPFLAGGASAGANLALAMAFEEDLLGLLLFYGVFGDDLATESHKAFGTGFGLDTTRVDEIYDLYDPDRRRRFDPRLCPLHATDDQLRALPPALLIAAGLDVLRDDTLRLAERLAMLDTQHLLHVEEGVTHGFINRGRLVPAADACLSRAARFIADLEPS